MTAKNDPEKLDKILQAVAARTNVTPEEVKSRSQLEPISEARRIYGWLAYRTRAGNLTQIGAHLGRKHSVAIYWRDVVDDRRNVDKRMREMTDELRKELSE